MVRSSSVCDMEPEKTTKSQCRQFYWTPCKWTSLYCAIFVQYMASVCVCIPNGNLICDSPSLHRASTSPPHLRLTICLLWQCWSPSRVSGDAGCDVWCVTRRGDGVTRVTNATAANNTTFVWTEVAIFFLRAELLHRIDNNPTILVFTQDRSDIDNNITRPWR